MLPSHTLTMQGSHKASLAKFCPNFGGDRVTDGGIHNILIAKGWG